MTRPSREEQSEQQLRSYYNVQDTPPELQHDFCSLWNEIVLRRRDRDHILLWYIFGKIRPIYVALHQDSTTCTITPNPDLPMPQLVDEQSHTVLLDKITPVASSFHLAPLENDRICDGTAADPIQGTTYPPAVSSVVNTSFLPRKAMVLRRDPPGIS